MESANRIVERFKTNVQDGSRGLLPYLTSGYPTLQTTETLIGRADKLGVTAVELGIPFSDSIADGPIIQNSFHQVLGRGQTVDEVFDLVARIRRQVDCGLIAMVSYSIVFRRGLEIFLKRAAAVGFDGVIFPDVPVEEAAPIKEATDRYGLCHIGLVASTTTPARRRKIAAGSSGFVYQIAIAGTTGERSSVDESLRQQVEALREDCQLPICVGFGISTPQQVRMVCDFSDGVIVGSALVRRIAESVQAGVDESRMVDEVSAFLSELVEATNASV